MDSEKKKKLILDSNDIVIHSGNVIQKVLMSSEEICDSFCGTLDKWINSKNNTAVIHQPSDKSLHVSCENCGIDERRESLKISVKLFLLKMDADNVEKAIKDVLFELKCDNLDSVVISLPLNVGQESGATFRSVSFQAISAVWGQLESLVEKDLIKEIGVCDFDAASLKELYDNARVKPSKNQINLVNCCTPPDDLAAFAGEKNIPLFTHSDPGDILPKSTLKHILSSMDNSDHWDGSYLARYKCVIREREIVKSKGYFLCLTRGGG